MIQYQKEPKKEVQITLPVLSSTLLAVIDIAIGILLIATGGIISNEPTMCARLIIAPLSLLGGRLLLKNESDWVRLGLLIAGGFTLLGIAAIAFDIVSG